MYDAVYRYMRVEGWGIDKTVRIQLHNYNYNCSYKYLRGRCRARGSEHDLRIGDHTSHRYETLPASPPG